jgi:hypothetical protein
MKGRIDNGANEGYLLLAFHISNRSLDLKPILADRRERLAICRLTPSGIRSVEEAAGECGATTFRISLEQSGGNEPNPDWRPHVGRKQSSTSSLV